jgi:2-methylcitrate dehydratase
VRICREVALAVGGPATLIGTDRRTSPDLATFANAPPSATSTSMTRYVGRVAVHPSDHIAACLAVAEAERAERARLIAAIMVAL